MRLRAFTVIAALSLLGGAAHAQTRLDGSNRALSTAAIAGTGVSSSGGKLSVIYGLTAGTSAPGNGTIVSAPNYGSCTWDAAHDVGPCINSAIAAAAALGGGTVLIPAGTYGLATSIPQSTSGVHVAGAGVGTPRDTVSPSNFLAVTRLIWIGSAGATMMDVEPTGSTSMYSADVTGIVFDCASLANVCFKWSQVSHSKLSIGVAEPRITGAWLTTQNIADAPGTQDNDVWIISRSTDATYSPTGILLDNGPGSSWNTSYNRFWLLFAWYTKGDGVVFGNSDNNFVFDLETQPNPTNATGRPAVFANSAYVMPNGNAVNGYSYDNIVIHAGTPTIAEGFQTNSSIVAGGGNTGSGAPATTTLVTNATSGVDDYLLHFASTSGVVAGETANCGSGTNSGVLPNTNVVTVAPTVLTMLSQSLISGVASGVSCTFSYGLTASAVTGVYTLTAVDATHLSITAPAGGHTQASVAISGGIYTFTDLVLPFTGTPVAGDNWTLTVPTPSKNSNVQFIDKGNQYPYPLIELGATAFFASTEQQFAFASGFNSTVALNATQNANNTVGASSLYASLLGGTGNQVNSSYAVTLGGVGNTANAFASVAGGHNSAASGTDAWGLGETVTANGQYSWSRGANVSSRARYGADCYGSGQFSVLGDAQSCITVLRGSGSSTTAFALTADAAAASTINEVNIPTGAVFTTRVSIACTDTTNRAKSASWIEDGGNLLNNAGTVTYVGPASAGVAPTNSQGTVTGMVATITQDNTANKGLAVTVTPPTSNTDTWHCDARVETAEVQ